MRNIIITGGGFGNKGAEAMTYITISEIRKKFPKHKIYLYLPEEAGLKKDFKDNLKVDFLGWHPLKFATAQNSIINRIICKIRNRNEYFETVEIYKNSDLMIDISGYAIGSNWSKKICSDYLDNLEYARAFGIPVYLMPQSFGPFDFVDEDGKATDKRIADLFPGIKLICAREVEGFESLKDRYKLSNVVLQPDIVLNNKVIDYSLVFKNAPEINIPDIRDNSVCIIPNSKTFEFCGNNKILDIYTSVIKQFLGKGISVYILYHSTYDRDICLKLKNIFLEEANVIFLDKDFRSLEFNEIVKKFKFIVASRFHSIVHAYKNGIPCVALGWAVKYYELLKNFGEEEYFYDVRDSIQVDELIEKINKLDQAYKIESINIKEHLREVQKNNVFNLISVKG